MPEIKTMDVTGYSTTGIKEAIQDALHRAGDYVRIEIIEARGSQAKGDNRQYQVTLATFAE